jgi:hypothetical protein
MIKLSGYMDIDKRASETGRIHCENEAILRHNHGCWDRRTPNLLVTLDVDALTTLGVLVNLLLESRFNGLENFLVALGTDEADSNTLGTETTSTTDTMEVSISGLGDRVFVRSTRVGGRVGHIVVDGEVDTLDIDTTAENIGADTDSLVVVLEGGVAFDTVMIVRIAAREMLYRTATDRSSWLTPECTAMDGKLHSRKSRSSSVARTVLLTKMMTWLYISSSSKSLRRRFFSASERRT